MPHRQPPTYHWQNKSLDPINGEQWKDIPGLDRLYRISSYGRVQRLSFEIVCSNGMIRKMSPKILHTDISRSRNKGIGDDIFFLFTSIMHGGRAYKFSIARLVHHRFNRTFDLDNHDLVVIARDGNGQNIRPGNLQLVNVQQKQLRMFERGRMIRTAETSVEEYARTGRTMSAIEGCRQVTQYTMVGRKIQTFPSITVAAEMTGSTSVLIHHVLTGRQVSTNGHVWAYGNKARVDVAGARRETLARRDKLVGRQVTQYDRSGNRIAVFDTIAAASRGVGIGRGDIGAVLSGKQRSAGGFVWRAGAGRIKINLEDVLTGEAWRAQRRWKPVKLIGKKGKIEKTFASVKAAAEALGVGASYVSMAIAKKLAIRGKRLRF